MEPIRIKYCHKCINYNDNKTCSAFPNGIPIDILTGKLKHTVKFPEQVGDDVFEDEITFLKSGGIDTTYLEQYRDDQIIED